MTNHTQPSQQVPVARLEKRVSDRPYSEGSVFFDVVILDRTRCVDGMQLFADPQQIAAPDAGLAEDTKRQKTGEAINMFFSEVDNQDGTFAFDPFDARDVDLLIDAINAV